MQKLVADRLAEIGLTARSASLKVSDNADLIRGLLRAPDTHSPRADTLEKVARALDLSAEAVFAAARGGAAANDLGGEARLAPVEAGGFVRLPRDVPVMGTAAGSLAGSFHFDGGVVDYVRRPPGLAGARDVYAIFITGESMTPEHRPGDLRFVNPHRPPAIGDTVIVQVRSHEHGPIEAYIKHLVRRTADWLVLAQLNQPAEIRIRPAHVVAVHKVLSVNELFGV